MRKQKKILAVNDLEVVQDVVALETKNHELFFPFDYASNGKEAVEKIAKGKSYDAILMNIEMPVMDGLEATRQIRALGYDRPILAWSAHSRYTMWEACKEVGMDEYIELDILVSNLIRDIIMGLIKVGVIPF